MRGTDNRGTSTRHVRPGGRGGGYTCPGTRQGTAGSGLTFVLHTFWRDGRIRTGICLSCLPAGAIGGAQESTGAPHRNPLHGAHGANLPLNDPALAAGTALVLKSCLGGHMLEDPLRNQRSEAAGHCPNSCATPNCPNTAGSGQYLVLLHCACDSEAGQQWFFMSTTSSMGSSIIELCHVGGLSLLGGFRGSFPCCRWAELQQLAPTESASSLRCSSLGYRPSPAASSMLRQG